ncbi:hypothetical protein QM646_06000 [Rhodococcus erythropolis]|nr:hypothetical protein [Rhodococcus erythropolis]
MPTRTKEISSASHLRASNTSTMSAAYQSVSTSGVQEAVSATPATASQYTAATVAAAK